MAIVIQIVIAAALVAVVMWMTTVYWRRGIHKQEMSNKQEKPDKRASSDMQLSDQQNIELKKDLVVSHKQNKALKSKLVFLGDVLSEVQRLNNSLSSYLKVLSTADLKPGQKEWDVVYDRLKARNEQLTEMVNGTIELLQYEDMTELEKNDSLQVNSFCQRVFASCISTLLICSMEFTHEGEIVLEVKHHRHKQKNYLLFTLSDTGMGIPEVAKEQAFEQMADLDNSHRVIVVRLRLCKALVRLLGGTISLDPSRKKGTAMAFTIPQNKKQEAVKRNT